MAFGQPFWNYGANNYGANNYNNYNGGYVAPQPQPNYLYPNAQQMPQNVNNGVAQQFQQPTQNTQQGLTRSDIIPMMYATYAEATAYRVDPMQRIMFSITDKPLFMLKQADINGRTMVEEYPITPKQTTEQAEAPQTADMSDFIKRNELGGYVTEERLKSEIKGITSDFSKQLEELKKLVSKGANKNG